MVRDQGLEELDRSFGGLAWSGVAAGLSIGFSFLLEAALQAGLPEAPWRPLVASFGYSLGFLIVVLGRQQLFTETTLTAIIPVMTERTFRMVGRTLRVWAIVLVANLVGTTLLGILLAQPGMMPRPMTRGDARDRRPHDPVLLRPWHAAGGVCRLADRIDGCGCCPAPVRRGR